MTISTNIMGNAVKHFDEKSGDYYKNVTQWRKARNDFLKNEGVSGIIKNGKKSKTFPSWWGIDAEFWFDDPIKEKKFIDKWK